VAWELLPPELWFVRRIRFQPEGGVIAAVYGRTLMAAIITSPLVVPAGLLMVRDKVPDPALAELAAR
jgi:hypothetical protein